MPIYQKRDVMNRRIIPLPTGDFGVSVPVTLVPEGYYLEYDVVWPLLPEQPLQPNMISVYRFLTNPGFVAGEPIVGAVGFDVQEIDFGGAGTVPDLPFVRGEIITDAATGATAVIGRRYSDNRYLVYDVTGLWGAGPVTGNVGGGGVTPGVVGGNVSITARFDSVHWKETTKCLFRENYGLFPPGSRILGTTSGVNATVLECEPPYMVAELAELITQIDTLIPADLMFKVCLLYGDLALLRYDLGAVADHGQRRALRDEYYWGVDIPHAAPVSTHVDFRLMQLPGRFGTGRPVPNIVTPANVVDSFFRDGFILRCYVSGGAGALPAAKPVFTRELTFNEYWSFQSVEFRNGI